MNEILEGWLLIIDYPCYPPLSIIEAFNLLFKQLLIYISDWAVYNYEIKYNSNITLFNIYVYDIHCNLNIIIDNYNVYRKMNTLNFK